VSYYIDEGIQDAKRRLKAYEAIQKRYPGARLYNDHWYADDVGDDATGIEVEGKQLRIYVEVEGARVYSHYVYEDTHVLFWRLQRERPKLYDGILRFLTRRESPAGGQGE
jgi:hypothetical protein